MGSPLRRRRRPRRRRRRRRRPRLAPGERGAVAVVGVWNAVVVLVTLLGFVVSACLTVAAAVLALAAGVPPLLPFVAFAAALACAGVNRASQALQRRWYEALLRRHAVVVGSVAGVVPVALPAVRDEVRSEPR